MQVAQPSVAVLCLLMLSQAFVQNILLSAHPTVANPLTRLVPAFITHFSAGCQLFTVFLPLFTKPVVFNRFRAAILYEQLIWPDDPLSKQSIQA